MEFEEEPLIFLKGIHLARGEQIRGRDDRIGRRDIGGPMPAPDPENAIRLEADGELQLVVHAIGDANGGRAVFQIGGAGDEASDADEALIGRGGVVQGDEPAAMRGSKALPFVALK
jgi:hypothetical protein